MVRFRKQARHCNFGESLEDNLRDQLIEKLPDIEWKKKLLEVKNISLRDAMDKVRLWESVREQATQMVNPSQDVSVDINAVGTKRGSGKICFNCGNEGHFGRDRNCPANGRRCAKSGKIRTFCLLLQGREKNVGSNLQNTTSRRKSSIQHVITIAGEAFGLDEKPICPR